MRTKQFEVVLCLRDLPHSFKVGDKTEFKFVFLDAVTTVPIPGTLLKIVRDKMLHKSIELTARYHIVVPEDYAHGVHPLEHFVMMSQGAAVYEGDENIGHVFSVNSSESLDALSTMKSLGRTASDREPTVYEQKRIEINEKRKKLLRDQRLLNVAYPCFGAALAILMTFTVMQHRWALLLMQIPIGFVLFIFSRMGKDNEKTLKESIW